MSKAAKKILIPVINDLATDQRVLRICDWWHHKGYQVTMYGRLLAKSPAMPILPFKTLRVKHFFHTGMFFYAEYSIRLFFFLLKNKFDVVWANDLDTLPASTLAKKLDRFEMLIYDSHEYFTEVPELQNNAFAKSVWTFFEKRCMPSVDYAFTVNQSISDVYTKKYNIPFHILRNIPYKLYHGTIPSLGELGLPYDKKIIILQGSGINIDRGAEEAVEAMQFLNDDYLLVIAGSGDVINSLKSYVQTHNLSEKVKFFDRMKYQLLMCYTRSAHLGLSLDKASNLNYKLSLPNKIFDYIQAHIPVLVSDLPELRRVVDTYHVGVVLKEHNAEEIAQTIHSIFQNEALYKEFKSNAQSASELLCRENEEKVLDILPL